MGKLLEQLVIFIGTALLGLARLLWMGWQWFFLWILKLVYPAWWPGFLRHELQAAIQHRIARLLDLTGQYSKEHWDAFKTQLPPANRARSVTSVADAASMTEFHIRSWGNRYAVYVEPGGYHCTPRQQPGTSYLQQDETEVLLQRVYQIVKDMRAERDRRARAAQLEHDRDHQRRVWYAEEVQRGQKIAAQSDRELNEFDRLLSNQQKALEATLENKRRVVAQIVCWDDKISALTRTILTTARTSKPVMQELSRLEADVMMKVAGFSPDGSESSKMSGAVSQIQVHYAKACETLLEIEKKIAAAQEERAAHFTQRKAACQVLSRVSLEFAAQLPAIQLSLGALRAVVSSLEDKRLLVGEWERLKRQTLAAKNDWAKTEPLLRSAQAWHLTSLGQNLEKKRVHGRAKLRGIAASDHCNELTRQEAALTASPPEEEALL